MNRNAIGPWKLSDGGEGMRLLNGAFLRGIHSKLQSKRKSEPGGKMSG